MTTDYEKLRADNQREYGTAIGRIGRMLLQDRYDKRTHFIFEVLQNAEDALRRRNDSNSPRAVRFDLTRQSLRISHFGAPFDEQDVRGVCGIDESTKSHTAIGCFGIGFKSVYAFTSRPEVHSGDESFSIEDYVLPSAAPNVDREPSETVILMPLDEAKPGDFDEIAKGLEDLGADSLLFLRHVSDVIWTAEDGRGGRYKRNTEADNGFMRTVGLISTGRQVEQRSTYAVFSRAVHNEGKRIGFTEIALLVIDAEGAKSVQCIADARLVVHFPTVLPTYTGFLIQGPYQTTPSRDNIPTDKPWNQHLVLETGELVVDVMRHLRDTRMLEVPTLRSLPLERQKLAGSLFAPLFDRIVTAFKDERLLPLANGEYGLARETRLARAQDVRQLFDSNQLSKLLGSEHSVHWLSADITADRTPDLRSYLMQELNVPEMLLDGMLARMSKPFLEEQTDAWILTLYELLASQPAIVKARGKDMPLIRLDDGRQVPFMQHGLVQAFLPTDTKMGFPTVRTSLCSIETLKFLKMVGLMTPDPVDDVIRHLLPAYDKTEIDTNNYDDDIARMLRAYQTDSSAQREKLVAALREASIVMATNAGTGEKHISRPTDVYIASARLANLFAGVEGVSLVDRSYDVLRGEKVREMLEACGATRTLRTTRIACALPASLKTAARKAAGCEQASQERAIQDNQIVGLDELLVLLPSLTPEEKRARSALLWEALAEFVERRGASSFTVTYEWFFVSRRSTQLDAHFVRQLNEAPWVADATGELRRPGEIQFGDLGWPLNPVLESKISFRPPAIAELAREVGIDADVLSELKRLGVTDLEQLRTRLKPEEKDEPAGKVSPTHPVDANEEGGAEQDDDAREKSTTTSGNGDNSGDDRGSEIPGDKDHLSNKGPGSSGGQGNGGSGRGSTGSPSGSREFISYVGVHSQKGDRDPDGLTYSARMQLEEQAIARILLLEPYLKQTEIGNEGFDLLDLDLSGDPQRWIEVKAMSGDLSSRPVGLSPAQIDHARRYADQYWLYVVEHAADSNRTRILKIRNPYGAAGTFTFDRGWEAIAEIHDCADGLPEAAE